MINSAFFEFSNTRTAILPVFPDDRTQATHDPVIEGTNKTACLGMAVISPPATNVLVQLLYNLPETPTTLAAGQFSYPVLEPFKALGMDANTGLAPGAGKAKPEIITPPGVTDGAFSFIDVSVRRTHLFKRFIWR